MHLPSTPHFATLFMRNLSSLGEIKADTYVRAIHPEDRNFHPNVLLYQVTQHLQTLGQVAAPSPRTTLGRHLSYRTNMADIVTER